MINFGPSRSLQYLLLTNSVVSHADSAENPTSCLDYVKGVCFAEKSKNLTGCLMYFYKYVLNGSMMVTQFFKECSMMA